MSFPSFISPMLSTLVDQPFDAKNWIFEIKWDGFRALTYIHKSVVHLYSRNEKLFDQLFPSIKAELQKKIKENVILDGEIVVLDKVGRSHFQLIQNYGKDKKGTLAYFVFDILYLNKKDLRKLPLVERKTILKDLLATKKLNAIAYSDHVEEKGIDFFKAAQELKLEGIIAKNGQSTYISRRSKDWLKIKTHLEQEVVIGGFTQPRKSRKKFGALIVGVKEKGQWVCVGHVGGGFTEKLLEDIYEQMVPLIQEKCPFVNKIKTNMPATWIKPKLVCEVSFSEWTQEGIMRQPIFKGMRIDKKAEQVKRELPLHLEV